MHHFPPNRVMLVVEVVAMKLGAALALLVFPSVALAQVPSDGDGGFQSGHFRWYLGVSTRTGATPSERGRFGVVAEGRAVPAPTPGMQCRQTTIVKAGAGLEETETVKVVCDQSVALNTLQRSHIIVEISATCRRSDRALVTSRFTVGADDQQRFSYALSCVAAE